MKTYSFYLLIFFWVLSGTLCAQNCNLQVNAGQDGTVCTLSGTFQLNASINGDFTSFSWSPSAGLSDPNILNPIASLSNTTTYTLTATGNTSGENLIINGDFENGNQDFTSDYTYSPNSFFPGGRYTVINNSQSWGSGLDPCTDHTSGSGQMVVVNGSLSANQNIWCQTVAITPDTDYNLSVWLASVAASSPAQLQFSINGQSVGTQFCPSAACVWEEFSTIWNSGSETSATLCIEDLNLAAIGNDFAIDDVFFTPFCEESDEVTIEISEIVATANNLEVIACDNSVWESIQLDGTGSESGSNIIYNWTSLNGNIVSGENTLMPMIDAAGLYSLMVTNTSNGCTAETEVIVTADIGSPSAIIEASENLNCVDTVIVLNATQSSGGDLFEWTTLDGNILLGEMTSEPVIDQAGTYLFSITNTSTGCTATNVIRINADTLMADLEIEQPLCFGDLGSILFVNITGGIGPFTYTIDGVNFGLDSFFDDVEPNNYELIVQDEKGCTYEQQVFIIQPQEVSISMLSASEVEITLGEAFQIQTEASLSSSQIATIQWNPSDDLDCENCLNPLATPTQTSLYTIIISDENNCTDESSILIKVNRDIAVYMPNIFSPNRDGVNDKFYVLGNDLGIKIIRSFHIFDRWGGHVFSDTNFQLNDPSHAWDGKYRGKELDPAVFVYYLEVEFIDGWVEVIKGDVTLVR